MSVRTLGRLVTRLERSSATARGPARPDAAWACMRRIITCPEAHRAAIRAGEWLVLNTPLSANPADYPEFGQMMEEVNRLLEAAENRCTS